MNKEDEAYGREWASMMGYVPSFKMCHFPEGSCEMWAFEPMLIIGGAQGNTEAEAYAMLGEKVRQIHKNVPRLPS